MGLNSALQMSSRSLEIFTTGIQVAGQNVANANTPGYVREEILLEPANPYRQGSLVLGTGAKIGGVRQSIDLFLEKRLHNANSDYAAADATRLIYEQLQAEINELGSNDLSTKLNEFVAALDEATNQPDSAALRSLVAVRGETLANDIVALRDRVNSLRSAQSVKVESLTEEANQLINEIAHLNPQITKLEASGLLQSDAGALRTQRYNALNRLSEIVPIKFQERSDGSVDVYSGTNYLILTGHTQQLELEARGDRQVVIHDVSLSETDALINGSGGELQGVIQGRDEVIGAFIDQLDQLTSSFIFEFNKIHSSGEGLSGYTEIESFNGVDDTSAALNSDEAGLFFEVEHGSFQLKVTNALTGITQTTNIAIDLDGVGTDTSLDSLQASLDAVGNISASISTDGHLQLNAADGYEIKFGNDTSGVLASLGINTFFTGTDTSNLKINEIVKNDQNFLATGRGGGPADNSNMLSLSGILDKGLTGLNGSSINQFYDTTITNIAQKTAATATLASGTEAYRGGLQNQREQFSGVSLDEEAIKIMNFQNSYQAAARLVTIIDELYSVLLNM
ncbi:Flagellar hook-associated protein 1 [Polystyrenella longa]|uniref:Flagellar hook-associated protein 1 n=1 Tax=Polystyrenella longa TaxID=2528007 RepID=A0A518CIU4_9PLAN|nr:flagellar hook-associated protein FlgK [Polystyrenella longa]QDU79140.1 Flagellar hook-associated protein 1 [Polystyrenella longa]